MSEIGQDSFDTRRQLTVDNKTYHYFSLSAATRQLGDITRFPYSLRILLENLLRHESNQAIAEQHIQTFVNRGLIEQEAEKIPFQPTRVILDESAGVDTVIDLASMRDAMEQASLPAEKLTPHVPTELILTPPGTSIESQERHRLIHWGGHAFDNLNVTLQPNEINFEHLAQTVWSSEFMEEELAYPDSYIGTSPYTATANALGVLGWRVSNIEAETAILGLPLPTALPEVIGVELNGKLAENTTMNDLATAINKRLTSEGVAGKIVEFYGSALDDLSINDRAIISTTVPATEAVCGYFPIDQQTIEGLLLSGRNSHTLKLVKSYAQTQQLWRDKDQPLPAFDHQITIDLTTITATDNNLEQSGYLPGNQGISTESPHAPSETAQPQAANDCPAASTFCWNPESNQIKPSCIPISTDQENQHSFKKAKILALLEGATNTNPAYISQNTSQTDIAVSTLVIFGGQDYDEDSKRSYAARTIRSQGVKAVIAESFNPTHRTDLIALGILPLEFIDGDSWQALGLIGDETIEIDVPEEIYPFEPVVMVIHRSNGRRELVELTARLDTDTEVNYYQAGGTLTCALQQMIEQP